MEKNQEQENNILMLALSTANNMGEILGKQLKFQRCLEKTFFDSQKEEKFDWEQFRSEYFTTEPLVSETEKTMEKLNFFSDSETVETANIFSFQTNEPGTKAVLNKCEGKLHSIILLASKTVLGLDGPNKSPEGLKKSRYGSNLLQMADGQPGAGSGFYHLNLEKGGCDELPVSNTLDFYLDQIKHYISCMGSEQFPDIYVLKIEDNPTDEQVNDYCVSAAKILMELWSCKAKFYLDTNGGPRDTMMILIGTLRAISHYSIVPQYAAYSYLTAGKSDFHTPKKILDKSGSYRFFDLVSGLDDYLTVGYSDRLFKYFSNNSGRTDKILSVLDKVQNMSHAFSLCHPEDMIKSVRDVVSALESAKDVSGLEEYVLGEIRKDFGEQLLKCAEKGQSEENFLIPLLEWSLKKNYIQQAITLYAERLPEVIVNKEILYYIKIEKNSKKNNKEQTNVQIEETVWEEVKAIRESKKGQYSEEYTFIQSYLCLPRTDNKTDKENQCYRTLIQFPKEHDPSDEGKIEQCDKTAYLKGSFIEIILKCNLKLLKKLDSSQRIYSKLKPEEAAEIMREYYSIKKLRDSINHASDPVISPFVKQYSKYENYQKLCDYMERCISNLKAAIKIAAGDGENSHIEKLCIMYPYKNHNKSSNKNPNNIKNGKKNQNHKPTK